MRLLDAIVVVLSGSEISVERLYKKVFFSIRQSGPSVKILYLIFNNKLKCLLHVPTCSQNVLLSHSNLT